MTPGGHQTAMKPRTLQTLGYAIAKCATSLRDCQPLTGNSTAWIQPVTVGKLNHTRTVPSNNEPLMAEWLKGVKNTLAFHSSKWCLLHIPHCLCTAFLLPQDLQAWCHCPLHPSGFRQLCRHRNPSPKQVSHAKHEGHSYEHNSSCQSGACRPPARIEHFSAARIAQLSW